MSTLTGEREVESVTRCAACGHPTVDTGLCLHHSLGDGDGWARGNRIMCDFVHRGIVASDRGDALVLEAA